MSGRQIILKDNGLLAVFSDTSDQFIFDGISEECYIASRREEAADDAEKAVRDTLAQIRAGEKPYQLDTMTYEEAVEWVKVVQNPPDDEEED